MSLVTLQVQFDDGADSSLVAQAFLDDQLNTDAAGEVKSQFAPGDKPFFLVHLDPRLKITQIHYSSDKVQKLYCLALCWLKRAGLAVGAAVRHDVAHRLQSGKIVLRCPGEPADATHILAAPCVEIAHISRCTYFSLTG